MTASTASWRKSVTRAINLASIISSATRLGFVTGFRTGIIRKCAICTSATASLRATITQNDIDHLNFAVTCAKKGYGHTFPNPAVGCVLVRQDNNEVIGAGFHPRAGFPHAEVFALFEATCHLPDGIAAAESVVKAFSVEHKNNKKGEKHSIYPSPETFHTVERLTEEYTSEHGPERLFSSKSFQDTPVTAYVTLEPCCHYGKTPPCAASLVNAKVARVVVGFRDPNPRVDGGGVRFLQDANIQVDLLADAEGEEAVKALRGCTELVADFVKRITPRPEDQKDYSYINGAIRRGLRRHAGRKKSDNTLAEIAWKGPSVVGAAGLSEQTDYQDAIQNLVLDPTWLETVDHLLWEQELILLRLNKAAKRKKAVKLLSERIADELHAHVAQTIGHTALLYRPGIPPILDLTSLGG